MSYLLDIFFPRTCPICHSPLEKNTYLCADCMHRLDRTEQAIHRDNATEVSFASMRHFTYGGCCLNYKKDSYLQQLIHQAKYPPGNPKLLEQLGRQAAMEWGKLGFFDGVDIVVPIPLHKRRLRERGFNQSEWIGKGLCEVLHLPMDTGHLTREKATKKQSQSSFEERQEGVKDAFVVNHPEEWYNKTILLVDDIITTGATMRAAIRAMKQVYGCHIVVFGLARAK